MDVRVIRGRALVKLEHSRHPNHIRLREQPKDVLTEDVIRIGISKVKGAGAVRIVCAIERGGNTLKNLIRIVDERAFIATEIEPLVLLQSPTGIYAELLGIPRLVAMVAAGQNSIWIEEGVSAGSAGAARCRRPCNADLIGAEAVVGRTINII